jgi:hypothetical protein
VDREGGKLNSIFQEFADWEHQLKHLETGKTHPLRELSSDSDAPAEPDASIKKRGRPAKSSSPTLKGGPE